MSTEGEKRYNPQDTTLKFVKRKDDITGDDDPDTLRAEMSCGHAVDPNSLTGWCRSLLDQGQYTFSCPALKDGSTESCGKLWPYQEVRRLAVLTDEEQQTFEEKVASLAAAKYCEFKTCPGCKTYVERSDLANLNVRCTICTAKKAKAYEFCWQCMNEWKGLGPRSDRCDNEGCANEQLKALQNCPLISLPETNIKNCPSMRACPTCGNVVEHKLTGCKNIICNRCKVEFCFACLELTPVCLAAKKDSWYSLCAKDIAPRQTSIPVWNRAN